MLNVQVTDDKVNVVFSRDLLNDRELMDFIDKVRVKNLISQSRLTEDDARRLDSELKSNWWRKNRNRFLEKIK